MTDHSTAHLNDEKSAIIVILKVFFFRFVSGCGKCFSETCALFSGSLMLFHPFLLPFLFPLTYRKRKYTSSAQCSGLCILKKHSGSFETAAFLHSSFRWFREESNWSLKRLLSCSICRLKMQRAWNLLLLSCVCSHCCMSTALWDRLHWDRFSLITWKLFLLPARQFVCTIHVFHVQIKTPSLSVLATIANYTWFLIPALSKHLTPLRAV